MLADAVVVDFSIQVDTATKLAAQTAFANNIQNTPTALDVRVGDSSVSATAIANPTVRDIVTTATALKSNARTACWGLSMAAQPFVFVFAVLFVVQ